MITSIILAVVSIIFTIFCGLKYAHPGSHRGYVDSENTVSWIDSIKHKWWDYRDIPVPVTDPLAIVIRTWWWLATGTNLKVWASIHRHNSIHEKKIWPNGKTDKGRLERAKMYPVFASNKKLVDEYGIEVPETWVDTNIFYRFSLLGPAVLLLLMYVILGPWCIIPWIAQMAWLPFWRSEAVNGWDPKEHEWNRLFYKLKDKPFCL